MILVEAVQLCTGDTGIKITLPDPVLRLVEACELRMKLNAVIDQITQPPPQPAEEGSGER